MMNNQKPKVYYEKIPIVLTEGIDQDLITEEYESLVEELICPICESLVINPVCCSKCEKPFCKYCIDTWLKKKNTCPNRCVYKEAELPRILRNLLNKVKVKCPNHELGCKEIILYENYEKHLNNCEYAQWRCLGENCGYVNTKAKVIDHVNNDCTKLKEKCKWCGLSFDVSEFLYHFNNCDFMNETCIYCGMNINKNNVNTHTHDYCCDKVVKNYEKMVAQLRDEINSLKSQVNNKQIISNSFPQIGSSSEVSFVSFTSNGTYVFNGKVAGTNKLEDLYESSLTRGKLKYILLILFFIKVFVQILPEI